MSDVNTYQMIEDIHKEIEDNFENMNDEQTLLVSLLSTERMWLSFVNGLRIEADGVFVSCVRSCLELMWDRALNKTEDIQQQKYNQNLDVINSFANEEDPESEFLTSYPLYLIGQLFVGISMENGKRTTNHCSSATVRTLDMICDNVMEKEFSLKDKIAIHQEIVRIHDDLILVKAYTKSMDQILAKKKEYQLLNVLQKNDFNSFPS